MNEVSNPKTQLLARLCDPTKLLDKCHILDLIYTEIVQQQDGTSSNQPDSVDEWLEMGLYQAIFECLHHVSSKLSSISSSARQLQQNPPHESSTDDASLINLDSDEELMGELKMTRLLSLCIQVIKSTDLNQEAHMESFCDALFDQMMFLSSSSHRHNTQQQDYSFASSEGWSLSQQPEIPHLLYMMNELMKHNEALLRYFMIDMNGVNLVLDLYGTKLATSALMGSSSSSSNNHGHYYGNRNNGGGSGSSTASTSTTHLSSSKYSHARRPTISSARGMMSPRLSPNNQLHQRPKLLTQNYSNMMAGQSSVRQERTKSTDFSSIYTSPNNEIPAALVSPRVSSTATTGATSAATTTTTTTGATASAMLSPLARASVLNLSALTNHHNHNSPSMNGAGHSMNNGAQSPMRNRSSSSVSFSLNLSGLNSANSNSPLSSNPDSPASRLKVPPLSLPMKTAPVNTMTSYTRSSRRMNHDLNYVNLDNLKLSIDTLRTHTATTKQLKLDKDGDKLFQSKTIVEYFGSLAAKLGELYIANDLTFLIPIRRDLDLQLASQQHNMNSSEIDEAIVDEVRGSKSDDEMDQFQFREDPILLLLDPDILESITISRYFSLLLLQKLTRFHLARKISRNPVNLLMSELNNMSEEFRNDKSPARTPNEALIKSVKEEIFNIIYDILSQYAEDVEAKYFHLWRNYNDHASGKKIVYDPTRDRALKKFDIFLWRWAGIVDQIIENEDLVELEYQLKSLSRYLNSCISRVHASQCTAVCLETLLRIQVMARQMSHSSYGLNYGFHKNTIVHVIHHMLEIFDFIMDSPERHPLLMEFFYFNLVDNEDNFYWLREYAKFLLLNDDLDIEAHNLESMRLRLMKHYQIIMNLFQDLGQEFLDQQQKRIKTPILTSADSSVEEEEENNSVMKQFDFLVNPVDGLVLHFLTKGPIQQQYTVKREMLKLLDKIFRLPNLPFMHIESYVSTYIRYHYLNFVKLYISPATDPQTLEACTLHLNVLIAFSINKTPVTTDRFFRMKVVRFLAREVSLEHEIDEKFKKHRALESKPSNGNYNQGADSEYSETESDYESETEEHSDSDTEDQTDERTDDSYLDSPNAQTTPPKSVPGLALKAIGQVTAVSGGINLKLALPGGSDVKPAQENSPKESAKSVPAIKKPVIPLLGMKPKAQEEQTAPIQKPVVPSLSFGLKLPLTKVPTVNTGGVINDGGSMIINTAKSSAKSTTSNKTPRHNDDSSSDSGSDSDSEPGSPTPKGKSSFGVKIPSLSIGAKKTDTTPNDDDMDDIASVRVHNPQANLPSALANILKLKIGGASLDSSTPPVTSFKLPLPQAPSTVEGRGPSTIGRTSRSGSVQQGEALYSVTDRSITDRTETDINYGSDFDDEDEFNHEFASDDNDFMDRRLPFGSFLLNGESQFFNEERKNRKLYHDEDLHVAVLGLLISLLITKHDALDARYCDQFPLMKNMLNIPYMLHYHINDQSNETIVPKLHDMVMTQMGLGARILLKLLCRKLFEPQLYSQRQKRIGFGAFGDVWRCELRFKHSTVRRVAVKLLKVPSSIDGPCLLYNIFNEILIMEKFKADSRICRLYDYGLDNDYYYIVMKEYKCSLKKWRGKQKTPLALNMPLYLNIFKRLLEAFKFLSDNNVNHFDIKCDNIFIDPYDGIDEEEFFNHTTDTPCFEMAIGDFGESYVYSREHEDDGYTTRHRGTDCIKSPEMLKIEMMNNTSKFYDRRRKVGANSASDVWSLGCLFYELLSGEFLFDAEDFTNFFMIVTDENKTLISQERYMKINYNSLLMDVLIYILIRDPVRRPSIADILAKYSSWQRMIPSRDKLLQMMKNGVEWEEPKIQDDDDTNSYASSKNEEPDDYMYDLATPHTQRRKSVTPQPNALRTSFSPLLFNATNKSPGTLNSLSARPKTPVSATAPKSAKDKPKESTNAALPLHTYVWHKSDIMFYIRKATAIIKNRLFIVSEDIAGDKSLLNRLGITHVINCSVTHPTDAFARNTGNLLKQKQLISKFENNFFYMSLKHHISDNPTQAYIEYQSAFEFVKDAIKKRGRVMIYSGKGLSRGGLFAVLFLMNTYNISSYEAYLSVKNHRPALRPEILTHFLHFLLRIQQQQSINKAIMEGVTLTSISKSPTSESSPQSDILIQTPNHSYQKIRQVKRKLHCASISHDSANLLLKGGNSNGPDTIHWYQCLCGVCVVGVVSPFYLYRVSGSNIKDDISPLKTWPSFLQEMKLLYFYEGKHLNMGFTTREKVLLDPFDVREHTVPHETVVINEVNDDQRPPMWQLNKCKYCGFMVFANKNTTQQASYVSVARSASPQRKQALPIRPQPEITTTNEPNTERPSSKSSIPIDEVDICINATLKTANIVTTTLANKIQDLRPSLFFRMNSQ